MRAWVEVAATGKRAPAGAGRMHICGRRDTGSATVEFLGVALLLLVPLVYLVLVLGKIQAAVFAGEGAAREAGRIIARAASVEEGAARAQTAVEMAFADQAIAVSGRDALHLECERVPCLTPGSRVLIEVSAAVDLPGVPAFLSAALPTQVPVSAVFVTVVDEFREAP